MRVKKQQLELDMKQLTGSKLEKEYNKAVYCNPVHLTHRQSISCEMPGWMKHMLESRLPGEISTTSDDTTLMAESEEELKSLFMRVKGGWKCWLETQHSKTKIMASSPITSWQIEGGKVEAVTDFIFLGSKITSDSDCSHENKRRSLKEKLCQT